MTAAVHIDNSVQDIAGQRMRGLDVRLRMLLSMTPVVRCLAWLFEGLMRRALARFHVTFKSQAIWFRGAAEEVLKLEPTDLSDDFHALLARQLSVIDRVKSDILSIRESLMESGSIFERRNLTGAAKQAIGSATDLFDAMESYRWALLEVEANFSQVQPGFTATDLDSFDRIFDRISASE